MYRLVFPIGDQNAQSITSNYQCAAQKIHHTVVKKDEETRAQFI